MGCLNERTYYAARSAQQRAGLPYRRKGDLSGQEFPGSVFGQAFHQRGAQPVVKDREMPSEHNRFDVRHAGGRGQAHAKIAPCPLNRRQRPRLAPGAPPAE